VNRRGLLTLATLTFAPTTTRAATRLQRFGPNPAGPMSFEHRVFRRLLGKFLRPSIDGVNRVDYRGWKASAVDMAGLEAYLRLLQGQDPRVLTQQEQFAYWVNLYNAETIRVVLAAYPVKSILAIRPTMVSIGPWKAPTLTVAGVDLSLDDIEHGILRPHFGEPRVHYALNCASLSCPSLNRFPWRGATLDRDLDTAAKAYVNHPRGVRGSAKGLTLSALYKWYRADFGGGDAKLLAHLRLYAEAPLLQKLHTGAAVAGYDYDWTLNDEPGP
jgi:hypothetical protein